MDPSDAVELIAATVDRPLAVLTVEHASNRLPAGWSWPPADQRLVDDHWAYDLGIAAFARALAAALGAPAVLSRFTRLLVDPNRPLDAATLFRREADGEPVALNAAIDDAERRRRIDGYWAPYHAAIDQTVAAHPGAAVVGLHSYTPLYEGTPRAVEVGVLYERDPDLGQRWLRHLDGHGYDVRLNEPWSGLDGLMYSPQRHATAHARRCVELELRYDLLLDPTHRARLVDLVADTVRATLG